MVELLHLDFSFFKYGNFCPDLMMVPTNSARSQLSVSGGIVNTFIFFTNFAQVANFHLS